ncbi:MAG: sulfatase-like hydrolase/transferase [Clostridiales bacterium]|nr:sulfatase-like hydrolase/transferase [Clostridiales bacterium]
MKKIKSAVRFLYERYPLMLLIIAVILTLIIETLGRHSFIGAVSFMCMHPLVFICNMLLIYVVISLSLFFRRRIFATCMLSLTWLAVGITNGVVLANRMTPFNVKDMSNLEEGAQIITNYFNTVTIIIACVAVGLLVLGAIVLFRKTPKLEGKLNYKRITAIVIVIIVATAGAIEGGMKTGVLDTFFANLAYAYRDNGVAYSFLITWIKTGIDKPADYSAESIEGIFTGGELGDDGVYTPGEDDDLTEADGRCPNIIFLQLESFMDPERIKNVRFSQDAIPNFRKLEKTCSTGYLEVPAVGAGTANVEFEAITGVSARFFGPGEYPYKSVLTENTCETVPNDLRLLGYSSHAIHNHRGAFYNRNTVFRNMGFDTFSCLEYMNNVVKTPKNWAKDGILTEQILDALNSTEGKDYIYTISVQGHGKYPTEEVLENPVITVTDAPDEESKWAWEYYVNQVYEMDIFLGELIEALEDYDEDIVLVAYGDHLPALDITEDQLDNGNLYSSQYIVWSNFGLTKRDADTSTYEITPQLLKRLGISAGIMTKFHQNYSGTPDYSDNLKALSYDMLYGDYYVCGGSNPYEATDMRMGVKPIKIDEIVQIGEKYYIKGQNFTEYSKISLDGEVLKTVYLGPTILALNEEVNPEDASRMKVSQVEKNKEVLSTTE